METTGVNPNDDGHGARLAETKRLLDEMDRLEMRARLLLAEHRHVLATMSEIQEQLGQAVDRVIAPRL